MCAIMVVLQLMLPRDSLSNMVSLLSLQSNETHWKIHIPIMLGYTAVSHMTHV